MAAKQGSKHHMAKLTDKKVRTIRKRLSKGDSIAEIARDYGVVRNTIHQIRDGKSWSWLK